MTARSPFDEAAKRLDRLVREMKEKQFGATGVRQMPLAPPPSSQIPPDAAWLQHYAARSIRPQREGTPPMPELPVSASPAPPPRRVPNKTGGEGPIGAVLGKPVKTRGRLARLFARRKP